MLQEIAFTIAQPINLMRYIYLKKSKKCNVSFRKGASKYSKCKAKIKHEA